MVHQKNELEYIKVTNEKSSIKIALQGAHIFDFQVKGKKPLLFLSESARFEEGFPIRGGIPICWPWFGPHAEDKTLPNHGFARIMPWKHLSTQELSENKTKISLALSSSDKTLALWPYKFELILDIYMSDKLEVHLSTKNLDDKDLLLSQALHTYLRINDIHTAKIKGLENTKYYNKINDSYNNLQEGALTFTQEVDRVYEEVQSVLEVEDIKIQTLGSKTVVIWNPAKELTNKMPDLSSFKNMLCIESASTLKDTLILKSDQNHTLKTIISQN